MSKILIDEATVKLALEALEDLQRQYAVYPNSFWDWSKGRNAIAVLREALAEQPAQREPAFYRYEDGHLMTPDRAKFLGFDLNDLQALYTSPPAQRKPLTKVEVNSWDLPDHPTVFEFAQFVEAKLKEKNT